MTAMLAIGGLMVASLWPASTWADGAKDAPKKLKFKWSITVTHPDNTTTTTDAVAAGGRLAMQSTDWSCEYMFRRTTLDDGKEREVGTVLCLYGGGVASVMFGTACSTGDLYATQHMIITEDSLKKKHVIRSVCEKLEVSKGSR